MSAGGLVQSESAVLDRLSEVSMDVAVAQNTGLERAHAVEQCSCPRGYKVLLSAPGRPPYICRLRGRVQSGCLAGRHTRRADEFSATIYITERCWEVCR